MKKELPFFMINPGFKFKEQFTRRGLPFMSTMKSLKSLYMSLRMRAETYSLLQNLIIVESGLEK